jgi:branched-chain amino acid transport system substrate-binding protein
MRFRNIALGFCLYSLIGAGSAASAQDITVAVALPLTGTCAQDGTAAKNGATLAAEIVNSKGGINGRKIKLIAEDDRSDPKEAASVANKLANNKDVVAVIGHYNSSCTLAGHPIYARAHLLELSPASSAPSISVEGAKPNSYIARVIATDAMEGAFVAKWMVKDHGLKKVAILWENDDYGLGLKDVVEKEVQGFGGQCVAIESYYMGETKDFRPILTKVRALNPDVLFIGGLYNEAALIAKQAADMGWKPKIYGTDAILSPALVSLGGQAVEGLRLCGAFVPDLPKPMIQEYCKAFRARFNTEPALYDAMGYDAMLVVAECIRKGGATREGIWGQLHSVSVPGVTGLNKFAASGDVNKEYLKLQVKNQQIGLAEN